MKIKDLVLSLAGAVIRIAILIMAIYVIIGAGKKAYDFGYRIFTEEPMAAAPGRDVSVTVSDSDTDSTIATMLEEKGLIREALLFRIQKKLSIYKDDVEPGTYSLNTSMTTDEMLEIMVGHKDPNEDESLENEDELDILSAETEGITGLESGGVLAEEEGSYDEAAAFADEEAGEEDSEDDSEGEIVEE